MEIKNSANQKKTWQHKQKPRYTTENLATQQENCIQKLDGLLLLFSSD